MVVMGVMVVMVADVIVMPVVIAIVHVFGLSAEIQV